MTWGSNVVLTYAGYQVTVNVKDDEEVWNKVLSLVNIPQASNKRGTAPVMTKVVDLQRTERRINIDGMIVTDATVGSDTHQNASDKKYDLYLMFTRSIGTQADFLSMTYEGGTVIGNIDKWSIKRVHMDGTEPTGDEIGFEVKFTFIVCIDLV